MTLFLTAEQILFIHSRLIDETGGSHGVRDVNMLLSALSRPQATYDDIDVYADLFSKGAALFDSLIRNHPFLDGNKRTAIVATGLFLKLNGYLLIVDNDEMVRFTIACAQSQLSFEQIVEWVRNFSLPIGKQR